MNKLFSKFAIVLASFAMTISGIVLANNKEAREVNAATNDMTIDFTKGNPGWRPDKDDTSDMTITVENVDYTFNCYLGKYQSNMLMFRLAVDETGWIKFPAVPNKKLVKVKLDISSTNYPYCKVGINTTNEMNFPNSIGCYTENPGNGANNHLVFNLQNTQDDTSYYLVAQKADADNVSMFILDSFTLTYQWDSIENISFSSDELTVEINGSQTLTPILTPSDLDETLIWYSDNEAIATVDENGKVDGVAIGNCNVICYSDINGNNQKDEGEVYGTIAVTVTYPSGPYVIADRTNINSYTGLTEKVRVNFGNLTDDFRFETENADLIHIDEIFSSKLSIFNITCLKAGIAEISLLDGDFVMGTITLNITQSEITITGLPSSKTMLFGTSLDLGSLISVNATGCYSKNVAWSSSDESVATVDSNGVVNSYSEGTATITVRSADNSEVYASCDITVQDTLTAFFSNDTYIHRTMPTTSEQYIRSIQGYSISNELTFSNLNRFGVGDNTPVVLSINDEQGNGHFTLGINNGMIDNKPAHFTEVTIRCKALYESQVVPFSINGVEKSATGEGYNNYTVELTKRNVKEVTFVNLSDEGISLVISSVTFKFDYDVDAKTAVKELNTQTSIAYRYEKAGEDYFISDKTIRFGGVVDKGLWNELDMTYGIVSFGVLICETELFENPVISDNFMFVIDAEGNDVADELGGGIQRIIDFSVDIDDMEGTIGDDGDNYFWNLRFNIPTDRYDYEMNTKFTAAAYIAINDGNDKEYILMNQVTESFLSIAQDYIDHRGCDETTAGGSLWYLSQYYKNMGL